MSNFEVIDNRTDSRYEMQVDGQMCFINYRRSLAATGAVVNLLHAEVPHTLRGRGYGAQLVHGALELIQQQNERCIPSCPFVAAYIRRHPEYESLLMS